jgi:hypothetical protein
MTDVDSTLKERGARYGATYMQDAATALAIIGVYESSNNWHMLAADQKHALIMIAVKQARILNGDPDYSDNWHDIQGYARLVEKRLTER